MKILCVLYDDPKGGMPKSYPLSDLPKLEKYPDGMSLPTPNPTAKGKIINDGNWMKETKITPTKEVNKWPKKIFFGCAKGLSG